MTKQLITLCVLTLAICLTPAWSQVMPDGVQIVQYDVLLSPSHEVPALPDTDASGTATIEFSLTRAAGNLVSATVTSTSTGEPASSRRYGPHTFTLALPARTVGS